MTIRLIVTHPGSAHKDDFLACSLLAHLHGVPIHRREPTDQDLADATTCVVDVGGSHDAELPFVSIAKHGSVRRRVVFLRLASPS